MKNVVIIGAGIAGLAAGWYHKQKGHAVKIYEKSDRPGGWIKTAREGDFLFEQGPRSFRSAGKGKQTLALAQELGLTPIEADKSAQHRYVLDNGKLRKLSLPFMLRKGLLGALAKDTFARPSQKEDETIGDFFRRRFNRSITESLADALVKGIFGGDLEKLSVRSCFPALWEAEKKGSVRRNLKREKSILYTFEGGMETLPKTLAERLEENIVYNTDVKEVEEADHVIIAVPPYGLTQHDPFTYETLTTVSLGWSGSLLPKKGFGFLVPSKEKAPILGMTWDSEIFPQQNNGEQTRICVMMQGEGTLETALSTVERYLGIKTAPEAHLVTHACRAIPQYLFGHHIRLAHFQRRFPYTLLGNSYTGVGINDCIEAAWKSALS